MPSLNNADDNFDFHESYNDTIWPAKIAGDIGQQNGNVREKVSSLWLKIVLTVLLVLVFSFGLLCLLMTDKMDKFQLAIGKLDQNIIENKLKVNGNCRQIEAIISELMPFVIGMVIGACLLFILLKVNGGKEKRGEMEENKEVKGREKELAEENNGEEEGGGGMEDNEEEEEGRGEMEEENEEEEGREEMEDTEDEEEGRGKMEEENEEEEGREEMEDNEEEKERREGICKKTEKNYLCDVCGKRFAQASAGLCQHRHVHTGKKIFLCDVCGKRFTQASGLWSHRHVHKEKSYECDACGRTFKAARNLVSHRKRCKNLVN